MFQGEYADGKARHLQQSIFIPLWICVVGLCGGGLCVMERDIPITLDISLPVSSPSIAVCAYQGSFLPSS